MSCDSCCEDDVVDGIPSTTPAPSGQLVLWEADFTAQGNVVFADGAQSITGIDGRVLPFTIANTDRAASGAVANWGFESGVGLNFLASILNGTWTAAAQTAARLTIPYATLVSTFLIAPTTRIVLDIYAPLITYTANSPDFGIGVQGSVGTPTNSGNRIWATKRAFRAATQVSLATGFTGDSSNYTTAPGGTADVMSITLDSVNMVSTIGTWAAGWPIPSAMTTIATMAPGTGTIPSLNTLTGTVAGFAFASNGVAGTMRIRAQRMRISSIS